MQQQLKSSVSLSPKRFRSDRAELSCLLVTMPFALADRPSIQLGLLAASGRRAGFSVETLHANLDFVGFLGREHYEMLGRPRRILLGDWLFSVEAFGRDAPDPDGQLMAEALGELDLDEPGELLDAGPSSVEEAVEMLLDWRNNAVPKYLDGLAASVDWGSHQVVGFTSTFEQTAASAALARRVRELNEEVRFVFGGANFDGAMGVEFQRSIPEVDFVIQGEADDSLPRFLSFIAGETGADAVPGLVWTGSDGAQRCQSATPVDPLDALPEPAYDEYFERSATVGLELGRERTILPIETSRGCWWGQRRHCTFCGLNGSTMAYRSKSPERALAEFRSLAERYSANEFFVTDNIMDRSYPQTLFAELAADDCEYEVFYEAKASLPPAELVRLAQGGLTKIQPGIESLSSTVLRLMDKGEKAITNVNMLRWSRSLGLRVIWGLLCGFPGESAEDYDSQRRLVADLSHLEPPLNVTKIWMERFSPVFADRERFPSVRWPTPGYALTYPERVNLDEVAYFFDYEFDAPLPLDAHDQLRVAVMWWREGWFAEQRPSLIASIERGGPERVITLADQRDDERAGSYSLTGDPAAVYLAAFEKPISIRRLGGVCPGVDVAGIVERFVSRGVMMRDGNLVLALAVPDDAAAWLSACDDFCTAVYASQDDESTSAAITLGREAGLVGQSMV